ncbi:MAG: Tad domain-containing protein [Alphaproteobacteria bacterium]|nr:Tad domain-containing protein [Alphaproteobacteria bacterium]
MRRTSKFLPCTHGSVTPIVAVTAPIVLLCAGAAIDYATFVNSRNELQAKLDATAISSAYTFIERAGEDVDAIVADIRSRIPSVLAANGGPGEDAIEVAINAENQTVSVEALVEVPTIFLRIAGFDTMTDRLRSSATAEVESQPVCVLALKSDDGTGIAFEGSGEMKAKDCVVWSNATGMQSVVFDGGGKVSTSRLCARGRVGSLGRFTVKPNPESDCDPVDDPMKDWTPPQFDGCNYRIEGWVTRTTAQLDPGVYCGGLKVDAKNIFLSPGVYVVRDGPLILRGSSKIVGKSVSFLLDGNDARLDIDGKSQVELKAPQSGPMAGIVIAASRGVSEYNSTVAGRSDLKIGGVIYLPTHNLTYYGESDTRAASPVTTIIANTIEIGGESYLEVKNDKSKAKYAPVVSTRSGTVRLID